MLIDRVSALPELVRKSLAWDRGTDVERHAWLSLKTDLFVFFADRCSSWHWPTNENTNQLIWEYLPKGTEVSVSVCDPTDGPWGGQGRGRPLPVSVGAPGVSASHGGVGLAVGRWWADTGHPAPGLAGSRFGKMLRQVGVHLYWTLHCGAHGEHFRPRSRPSASSVRLAHHV